MWQSKNKLLACRFDYSFRITTTALSETYFIQSRREPTNHIVGCIVENSRPEISVFFQKGFSHITGEVVGRATHAVCLKGWDHMSVFHTNTLINMYSKVGNIRYARQVFDEMPNRDEASWGNMISGYVKSWLHLNALRLFIVMRKQGFELTRYNTPSLLTAVCRAGNMFFEGLQIHSVILKNGMVYNVFVGTSLLHFYGSYGLISDARMLFEELPDRNVVTWTSLMVNIADAELYDEVFCLYKRMRAHGESCNQNTFTTFISSCAALNDEFLVHQVLGHVIKSGLDTDISVANSLISTFGTFGRVEVASYIFDKMDEHDTISWNSILAAFAHGGLFENSLEYFHLMRINHGEVDESTLSTVLLACDVVDNLKWGRGIHGLVLKLGSDFDICVANTLLSMYFATGRYKDAELLFHNLPQKDLISWNSLMAGYVSAGKSLDALRVLRELLLMGYMANFVTFASALSSCANAEFLEEGKCVHALAITSGIHDNMVVGNGLLTMYGKCGMTQEAKRVFQNMPEKELVTWNALICGYAENEDVVEATKIFKMMRERGIHPNYITLTHVLGSCCDPSTLLRHGMPLHAHILLTGFESDEYVRNSIISMYANCGDLDSSNSIFSSLVNRTTATWNSMIAAKAHYGQGEEALKLLLEMQRAGVGFDQFCLSSALSSSADLAILEDGQHLHGLTIKLGFDHYHFVANATMDMYGKCGELNDLLKVLPDPNCRLRISWNVLISAFARHGYFQKAKGFFQDMLAYGVKPDHVTFVALLSACSHGGLVDDGLAYFALMTSEFGVQAAIEHCVCIVDLLGRSGRLAEAEAFIKEMPVPPNDFVWRTLLAACKIHGDLELGKKAAKYLLDANPSDDSAYVLYSNVCATSGRWHDVHGLRSKMEAENVKKQPAYSWLNVRNKITSFGAGDWTHPEFEKIYSKLVELKKEIKEAGYVPDTSYALHDTDEEQKEDNLWMHSERLALAYGLISTQNVSTLRIFKNLRVCGDCHSMYKCVSSVVDREIILRDAYRFHHFRRGECSCNDYW